MTADRGLTVERMVELGGVSRASFYRFDNDHQQSPNYDMDLRDAIQRIALQWPSYGRAADYRRAATGGLEGQSETGLSPDA